MTDTTDSQRATLAASAATVLERLPAMGRIMLTARHGGAAHERIGPVESVTRDGADLLCRGACHDARITPDTIASVIIDRSGKMQDMVLPRLDFLDAAGEVLFSVIGMEGLAPFDAGVADLPLGEALPASDRTRPDKVEVAENDPGLAPFNAALGAGETVAIEVVRPGLTQAWQGTIASVKPGMGFINVMQPDFHLHLRGGSVARWSKETDGADTLLWAEDADGARFGLRLRGSGAAISGFQPS